MDVDTLKEENEINLLHYTELWFDFSVACHFPAEHFECQFRHSVLPFPTALWVIREMTDMAAMSLLNYLEPWNVPFSYGRVNVHDEAFLSRKMHKLASFVKGHLSWKTSLESTLDNLGTANTDWEEKPKLRNTETSFSTRCTSENCLPEWGNWTEYKALWNLLTPLKSTAWLDSYSCPAASTCPGHACPGTSTFVSVWSRCQLGCPFLSSDFVCWSHVHLFFGPWTLWSPPSPFQEAEPWYIISPLSLSQFFICGVLSTFFHSIYYSTRNRSF